MKDLFEIPLTSATTLDFAFGGTKTRATVQKLRQQLRKSLGGSHRGLSIGKLGTVQLENVALLPCLETAGRWSRDQAKRLTQAYQSAGLQDLIHSTIYGEAMQETSLAIREAVRDPGRKAAVSTSAIVADAVAELAQENHAVREVTTSMHEISVEVDRLLPEFRRRPGQLVRFEGRDAMVVVYTGDREELRTVSGDYLQSMGIGTNGEPFVEQRLQWSPDAFASVYVPAVDLAETGPERTGLEQELSALEAPLPSP